MAADAEVLRLTIELERAYRCIVGFHSARRGLLLLADTPLAYHAPTIAAARRFVFEKSLEGSEYFIGKNVSELHRALSL